MSKATELINKYDSLNEGKDIDIRGKDVPDVYKEKEADDILKRAGIKWDKKDTSTSGNAIAYSYKGKDVATWMKTDKMLVVV